MFGLAMGALSSFGMYLAKTPSLLLVFRAGAGLAASTWAIYMIAYNSLFHREEQHRAMGLVTSAMYGGQCVATLLGGFLAQFVSEQATFFAASAAGLLGLIILLRLPEIKTEKRAPFKARNFLLLLKNRNLLFYSAMGILMQAALYTGAFGFIPNILRQMGANNFLLGLSTTLSTVPAVFSAYLSGTYFRRHAGAEENGVAGFCAAGRHALCRAHNQYRFCHHGADARQRLRQGVASAGADIPCHRRHR